MATQIIITLKTAEDVESELKALTIDGKLPEYVGATDVSGKDRWFWWTPTRRLTKEEWAAVKGMGFNWSSKRGMFYHTTTTDPTKRKPRGNWSKGRKGSGREKATTTPTSGQTPAVAQPQKDPARPRYQPSNDVDAEFARRFG